MLGWCFRRESRPGEVTRGKIREDRGSPFRRQTHAPIREHPKPEPPHALAGEHVQEVRRVRVVDVVVCAAVRESKVNFVEGGDVGDGRRDIASWIDRWEIHVSFGVDRIYGRHEMAGHVTGNG